MGDRIATEEIMYPGSEKVSENGEYRLAFQQDSNLVLYRGDDVLWASNTYGDDSTNHSVLMQRDGNLVMYDAGGQPIWQSGSGGYDGVGEPNIVVQNDGNVCLYDSQVEGCFWSTDTYQG